MALKRSKLQQIPQRNKDLAFGFVKDCEKLNKSSIPDMIKYLCLIYINQNKDKFDGESTHQTINIQGNCIKKANSKMVGVASSLLTNIVSTGIHIWTFKANESNSCDDIIGIRKSNADSRKEHLQLSLDNGGDGSVNSVGYGLNLIRRLTNPADNGRWGKSYGQRWDSGDVIEMKLNFNDLSLSYKINEKDYGKAFTIESDKYRAAVTLYCSSYCLNSYQHIY